MKLNIIFYLNTYLIKNELRGAKTIIIFIYIYICLPNQ